MPNNIQSIAAINHARHAITYKKNENPTKIVSPTGVKTFMDKLNIPGMKPWETIDKKLFEDYVEYNDTKTLSSQKIALYESIFDGFKDLFYYGPAHTSLWLTLADTPEAYLARDDLAKILASSVKSVGHFRRRQLPKSVI